MKLTLKEQQLKLSEEAILEGVNALLADKGYDSDWFRAALTERGITPCIPPRKNRNPSLLP